MSADSILLQEYQRRYGNGKSKSARGMYSEYAGFSGQSPAASTPAQAPSPTQPMQQPQGEMVGPERPSSNTAQLRQAAEQLTRQRQAVFRQLRGLGPMDKQSPDTAAARESLIAQRHAIESELRPLSATLNPRQIVTPQQAEAGRLRMIDQLRMMESQNPAAIVQPPQRTAADFERARAARDLGVSPDQYAEMERLRSGEFTPPTPTQPQQLTGPVVPLATQFARATQRDPAQAEAQYRASLAALDQERQGNLTAADEVLRRRANQRAELEAIAARQRALDEAAGNFAITDIANRSRVSSAGASEAESRAALARFGSDPSRLQQQSDLTGALTEAQIAEARARAASFPVAMQQEQFRQQIEQIQLQQSLRDAQSKSNEAAAETPEINRLLATLIPAISDLTSKTVLPTEANSLALKTVASGTQAILDMASKMTPGQRAMLKVRLSSLLPPPGSVIGNIRKGIGGEIRDLVGLPKLNTGPEAALDQLRAFVLSPD